MYPLLYTIIIAVSIIALIGTILVAKDTNKNGRAHSSADEINSLTARNQSSSIPLLSIIYAITFVITIILVWIFIF